MTEEVTEKKIETQAIERRSIDLAIPISDPSKAQKELSWEAKRTLDQSVRNAYKFLSNVRQKESHTKKARVMHFLPYFPPHSGGVEMYAKEWVENYILE